MSIKQGRELIKEFINAAEFVAKENNLQLKSLENEND
jgi:hypothetical protein